MSISPVGGASGASNIWAAGNKPESVEPKGAADHDGDSDDAGRAAAPAPAQAPKTAGVDLHA